MYSASTVNLLPGLCGSRQHVHLYIDIVIDPGFSLSGGRTQDTAEMILIMRAPKLIEVSYDASFSMRLHSIS